MTERNELRKEAVFGLLKHKLLGVVLIIAILSLFFSLLTSFAITLFLFFISLYHDCNGYKFEACESQDKDDQFSKLYRERDVVHVMAYKMDNAVMVGVLMFITLMFTIYYYSFNQALMNLIACVHLYFCGVKEVSYYLVLDESYAEFQDCKWFNFTYRGWFDKKLTGVEVGNQAAFGAVTTIIFFILWSII